jgi:hypothetical protein
VGSQYLFAFSGLWYISHLSSPIAQTFTQVRLTDKQLSCNGVVNLQQLP